MFNSGIAHLVFSVTIRCEAPTDIPAPPPITTPSIYTRTGFGKYHNIASILYSAVKKRQSCLSIFDDRYSYNLRTSHPAHNPFSPAPTTQTITTSERLCHMT